VADERLNVLEQSFTVYKVRLAFFGPGRIELQLGNDYGKGNAQVLDLFVRHLKKGHEGLAERLPGKQNASG
jgi:hypothetical protein